MKTIVLVKQVPRPDSIEFIEETKSLKREGVPVLPGDFEHTTGFVKAGVVVSINGGPGMEDKADLVARGDAASFLAALL